MEQVAAPIAVKNATKEVKNVAVHITRSSGGDGAFREAVEWIVENQGLTEEVIKIMREKVSSS